MLSAYGSQIVHSTHTDGRWPTWPGAILRFDSRGRQAPGPCVLRRARARIAPPFVR